MLSCIVICRNTDKKPYDNTTDGGGAKKLSEAFGIPLQRAKQLIKTYYDTFKEVKPFFEEKATETKSQGFILINDITRRKSYIGEYAEYKTLQDFIRTSTLNGYPIPRALEARFDYLDAVISRHSSNYRIQGTSADMAKLAGIYLRQKSIETGLFKVLLLIHDEWCVECAEEDAQIVKDLVEECMVRASRVFLTSLEIPADGKITKFWSK